MDKSTVTVTVKLPPATKLIEVVKALRALGLDIRAKADGSIVASERSA